MKFDFWTFMFQIVNFVVLLFILKRLLFKPIREIMEKRRKTISDALSEADAVKGEAERLKGELSEELRRQKTLRREAEAGMRAEVDEQRKLLIEAARENVNKIIEKERALFDVEKRKFEGDLREQAVGMVSRYALDMLKDISDETLHRGILRKFQDEVKGIASDISGSEHLERAATIKVASAYPLEDDEIVAVRKAFETALGKEISLSSETDADLIAGIAVRVDDRVYDFSIQGQIRNLRESLGGKGDSWMI